MVVKFADLDCMSPPTMILRNLDGTPIQTLGYAFGVELDLNYNEVSTLSFQLPKYVDGKKTPHYDEVVGLRIVDVLGCGQFVLVDPQENDEEPKCIKTCKAYSLEYEFAKKNIYLEGGTYNFFDGTNTHNPDTIIGRILERMPDWTADIDVALTGKYRTFDDINKKIYDFIKSDLQQKYGCIFDFDTYTRTVRVRSVETPVSQKPVYLSSDALVKKIDIQEDSDSIVTCLDVYGGDGVDIRSVNPTGTNKIYNLDYFMNTVNFPQETIDKWHAWEEAVEAARDEYYQITISYNMKLMEILMAQADLEELNTALQVLINERATTIAYQNAYPYESTPYGVRTLAEVNADISAKEAEIAAQNTVIESLRETALTIDEDRREINDSLAFAEFFTQSELEVLNRYFIEDSMEDSSFVMRNAITYDSQDLNTEIKAGTDLLLSSAFEKVADDGTDVYSFTGGRVAIGSLDSEMIRGTMTYKPADNSFLFTAYLNSGEIGSDGSAAFYTWRDAVPDDITEIKKYIYNKRWQNGNKSILVKIPGGATKLELELNAGAETGYYALLASDDTTGNASFATDYTDRVSYTGTISVDIPEDAQYLWVYLATSSADISPSRISFGTPMEREESDYMSGNLTISGTATRSSAGSSGQTLTLTISGGRLYFTENATEYERHQIEWELMEHAGGVLREHAGPTYSFTVDAVNFLALDEYLSFHRALTLGERVYLNIDDEILTPYVVRVHLAFDDPTSFQIEFSNSYTSFDRSFALAKLLDQSVSMGKTLDYKSGMYSAFVNSGASSRVQDFMNSALDVAKNHVLSSGQQAITYDDTGIRVRKWADGDHETYSPEEIWMVNNMMVFTDDAWESAKMAVGKIFDPNLQGKYQKTGDRERNEGKTYYTDTDGTVWNPDGSIPWSTNLYEMNTDGKAYGIAAPYIVGTMIAGQNLVIDSVKPDGTNSVFRVDGSGASLYNANFKVFNERGQVVLDPELGIGIGKGTNLNPDIITDDGTNREWNDNARFWVDTSGNIHFAGTLEGADGRFTGELKVGGTATAPNFWVQTTGSLRIGPRNASGTDYNFIVQPNGDVTARNGTFTGTIEANVFKLPGANGVLTPATSTATSTEPAKVQPDYLELLGIKVKDPRDTTRVTFSVDGSTGDVTTRGSLFADGTIQGGLIKGSTIEGGIFHSTGDGASGTDSAYYVGYINSSRDYVRLGYFSYDDDGTGNNSKFRVRLVSHGYYTINREYKGIPIKMEATGNISIQAGTYNGNPIPEIPSQYTLPTDYKGIIYMMSQTNFDKSIVIGPAAYGSLSQRNNISNPEQGQLFFVIS